jgi:hypothetical protein
MCVRQRLAWLVPLWQGDAVRQQLQEQGGNNTQGHNKYLNLMSEWSADRENSSSKKVHICKPALLLWNQKTAGGSSIMPEMMIQPSKQPTRALPTLVNLLLLLMM